MLKQFHEHVDRFFHETVGKSSPGALAFDLTPGTGLMTLAWAFVPPAGSWLLYLQHQYLKNLNRPDPFTESYLMWRAGQSWENHVGLIQSHGDNT